ncbi:DNA methyltransferase [Vagococcus fluvialis]|uniref:DNA methyltransferase n=1 Tax=Vagococcus fluvialis TaxID=2738 RepID=UPI003B5C804A
MLKEIKQVLSRFTQYWNNEILLKNRVSEDLRNYEPELITALLSNESIKKQFEITINGTSIFKIEEFIQMLTYKDFWEDSYTKYSNKIGLTANGKYLDYNSDVVLDFPFKDCILEGGMTKEEVGKKEVYYNKVIARDEVDTLLSPKVFTNTKKYTKDGEEEVSEIDDTDNLIIKGNNLLALHSLKERYAGKVKCIYIDPPYNTGGDSFKYNDRFNHSTWLTFMKNRLEIARELLSDDGYIFIQTDDNEQAYLKVLLDDIFLRDQYVNTVSILFKNMAGAHGIEEKRLSKNIEFLTVYAKNKKKAKPFNKIYTYTPIFQLVEDYKRNNKSWKYTSVLVDRGTKTLVGETIDGSGDIIKIYRRDNFKVKSINQIMKEEKISEEEAYNKYSDDIYSTALPQKSSIRPRVMEKYREITAEELGLLSIEYVPKSGRNKGLLYEQFYVGRNFRLIAWLKDTCIKVDGKLVKRERMGTFWNFVNEMNNVNKEGQVDFNNGKKPERLLGRLIEMSTEKNDIVLDFFGGSGSTASTALKLNRRFISIEQLENQIFLQKKRLKNVIDGSDKNGISSDANWQGGGSFIYTELMDLNNAYINQIKEANTSTELLDIFEIIKKYADLNYLVELEKLTNEPITIDEDTKETLSFGELSLDKQKELLIDVMDINQLYVNYSEIDDSMYQVSEQDKAFNRSFYEEGDN